LATGPREVDRLIRLKVRRVNALASGVVAGLLAGLALFTATNWLLLKGGDPVGPHLALLGQFFLGYRVTFLGSLVGLVYGFASGLIVVGSGALLYNWIARRRGAFSGGPDREGGGA
jgi:hypothetical protein